MRWTSEAIDAGALRALGDAVTLSPCCRSWPSGKSLARVRVLSPAAASSDEEPGLPVHSGAPAAQGTTPAGLGDPGPSTSSTIGATLPARCSEVRRDNGGAGEAGLPGARSHLADEGGAA
jgi:hypothetical protein